MKIKTYKPGTKINIYQKPLSMEDYEGEATIIRCIHKDELYSRYLVNFGDDYGDVERVILNPGESPINCNLG